MLGITVMNEKNENDQGGGRSSDEGDFVIPTEKFSTRSTVARNSISGKRGSWELLWITLICLADLDG